MPLRPCITCGALVNRGSYCARHEPRAGSTRQWRKLRAAILARDGHTCQACGAAPATHVDHVVPLALGGSSTPDNLRACCQRCNLAKGDRPA